MGFALGCAAAACSRGGDGARGVSPGEATAQWAGKTRGSFTAPATARWCAADTLLEIIAVRGDTALGIALILQDSVREGIYPVNDARTFIGVRPQANVALRLLRSFELEGYDAMSGQVTVTQGGSRMVSGTFQARLRPLVGADTFQVTGSFDRLAVTPTTGVCGRANRPGGG